MKYSTIFCTLFLVFSAQPQLLHKPPAISSEALAARVDTFSCGMVWQVGAGTHKERSLSFSFHAGVLALSAEWSGDEEGGFVDGSSTQSMAILPEDDHEPLLMPEPRVIKAGKPRVLSVAECAELIATKKHVVFYTGAGISAGIVPTMAELMVSLSIGEAFFSAEGSLAYLRAIEKNPESVMAPMRAFFDACRFGVPTLVHEALAKILFRKDWGLITENVDLLHQRSGIDPLCRSHQNWIFAHVSIEDLRSIEAVVTLGLRTDESGFLAWYTLHNPAGIIIALNREQPNYLDERDFLVLGDLQELVPALELATI